MRFVSPLEGLGARFLLISSLLARAGAGVEGRLEELGEGASVLAKRGLDLARPAGDVLLTPARREWFQGMNTRADRAVSGMIRGLVGVATRIWTNRVTLGAKLLLEFGSDLTPADLALYRRVVQGGIINEGIAFDLTETLTAMKGADLYKGMLSLLVGLWATGNQLVLYTDDSRSSVVEVLNRYPLLQLVFGVTGLEGFPATITAEQVERTDQIVDYEKRLALVETHLRLGDPFLVEVMSRGISGAHLAAFKGAKLPFPEISAWRVLVDDKVEQRQALALLGFSQGVIVVEPTAGLPGAALYRQLADFFSA